METLNLLRVGSCEMFTFREVLHGSKQETLTNSTKAHYGEEASLTAQRKIKRANLRDPREKITEQTRCL